MDHKKSKIQPLFRPPKTNYEKFVNSFLYQNRKRGNQGQILRLANEVWKHLEKDERHLDWYLNKIKLPTSWKKLIGQETTNEEKGNDSNISGDLAIAENWIESISGKKGFLEILKENRELHTAVLRSAESYSKLTILGEGKLISSVEFSQILEQIASRFNILLFDYQGQKQQSKLLYSTSNENLNTLIILINKIPDLIQELGRQSKKRATKTQYKNEKKKKPKYLTKNEDKQKPKKIVIKKQRVAKKEKIGNSEIKKEKKTGIFPKSKNQLQLEQQLQDLNFSTTKQAQKNEEEEEEQAFLNIQNSLDSFPQFPYDELNDNLNVMEMDLNLESLEKEIELLNENTSNLKIEKNLNNSDGFINNNNNNNSNSSVNNNNNSNETKFKNNDFKNINDQIICHTIDYWDVAMTKIIDLINSGIETKPLSFKQLDDLVKQFQRVDMIRCDWIMESYNVERNLIPVARNQILNILPLIFFWKNEVGVFVNVHRLDVGNLFASLMLLDEMFLIEEDDEKVNQEKKIKNENTIQQQQQKQKQKQQQQQQQQQEEQQQYFEEKQEQKSGQVEGTEKVKRIQNGLMIEVQETQNIDSINTIETRDLNLQKIMQEFEISRPRCCNAFPSLIREFVRMVYMQTKSNNKSRNLPSCYIENDTQNIQIDSSKTKIPSIESIVKVNETNINNNNNNDVINNNTDNVNEIEEFGELSELSELKDEIKQENNIPLFSNEIIDISDNYIIPNVYANDFDSIISSEDENSLLFTNDNSFESLFLSMDQNNNNQTKNNTLDTIHNINETNINHNDNNNDNNNNNNNKIENNLNIKTEFNNEYDHSNYSTIDNIFSTYQNQNKIPQQKLQIQGHIDLYFAATQVTFLLEMSQQYSNLCDVYSIGNFNKIISLGNKSLFNENYNLKWFFSNNQENKFKIISRPEKSIVVSGYMKLIPYYNSNDIGYYNSNNNEKLHRYYYDHLGRKHYLTPNSGPTKLCIKCGSNGFINAEFHTNFLIQELLKEKKKSTLKPVLNLIVDNGDTQTDPRCIIPFIYWGRLWKTLGLDMLNICTHAPGESDSNFVNSIWDTLANKLKGKSLMSDYETNYNDDNDGSQMKHAIKKVCDLWGNIQYQDNGIQTFPFFGNNSSNDNKNTTNNNFTNNNSTPFNDYEAILKFFSADQDEMESNFKFLELKEEMKFFHSHCFKRCYYLSFRKCFKKTCDYCSKNPIKKSIELFDLLKPSNYSLFAPVQSVAHPKHFKTFLNTIEEGPRQPLCITRPSQGKLEKCKHENCDSIFYSKNEQIRHDLIFHTQLYQSRNLRSSKNPPLEIPIPVKKHKQKSICTFVVNKETGEICGKVFPSAWILRRHKAETGHRMKRGRPKKK
ncbi:nnp-1 protein putative nuclear protein 1 nop52 [Anaeramoeba flamelloides]|uniref:Nnp-1 protein putative nuclear protein 1 nop52 n=1 Tax=Anaeramoeba flamelloides TaxID=1746091 RepID=A0AAV7YBM1_9EUKA|nr:nnp-1 protein putative nuclear protein 1 nop52 [Anaeramoeba flamelloides]